MGFFGMYLFSEGRWENLDPAGDWGSVEPWMSVLIHDGDVAMVRYRPAGSAEGFVFLGDPPEEYFGFSEPFGPSDVRVEADGLAGWWALVRGGASGRERAAKSQELLRLLTQNGEPAEEMELGTEYDVDTVEADLRVRDLLLLLDLPLPDDLAE